MATDLSRDEIRRLARLGAERRLQELRDEEAAIRAAFPDLGEQAAQRRGRGRRRGAASPAQAQAAAGGAKRSRRGRTMSAAERKAVSDRMKKYWAARRKAKG